MYIFVIIFTIVIIVATSSASLVGAVGAGLVAMIGVYIYEYIQLYYGYIDRARQTETVSGIWRQSLIYIVLAIGVVGIYDMRSVSLGHQDILHISGVVSDIRLKSQYIVDTVSGSYIFFSKEVLRLGSEIELIGSISSKPVDTIYNRIMAGDIWGEIDIGDKIIAVLDAQTDFQYDKRLYMKQISANLTDTKVLVHGQSDDMIYKLRNHISDKIRSSYNSRSAGLALGMSIGDRTQISTYDYQNFINSGLVHIVAVSGGNIVILVIFLMAVLFRLPYYVRIGVVTICIVIYGMICGADSSVVRAVIMSLLTIISLYMGRDFDKWRVLGVTYIAMLIYNPYWLIYDFGFMLSYSAVVGIMIIGEKGSIYTTGFGRLGKICTNIYHDYILPSIGASIGISGPMIYRRGKLSLTSILGNIAISPILGISTVANIVCIYISNIPGLGGMIQIPQVLISYIYLVSDMILHYNISIYISGYYRFIWVILWICGLMYIYRRRDTEGLEI